MPLLAISGSTGHLGRLLLPRLDGLPLRLVGRSPERMRAAAGREVETARADYTDPEAMRAALSGTDTFFFVSAGATQDRAQIQNGVVQAAADAGVKRIVYLSFQGAGPNAVYTYARADGSTEEAIRASGLEYTFLRDNFYQEELANYAGDDGAIRGPAGNGRVAAVSRADVAAVAAAVLRDPSLARNQAVDVTGPVAFTLAELADALTRTTGTPHTFVDETLEEAHASRASYGAPEWEVEGWISTYTAIRDGELEAVSDTVQRLTGQPPRGFPGMELG